MTRLPTAGPNATPVEEPPMLNPDEHGHGDTDEEQRLYYGGTDGDPR